MGCGLVESGCRPTDGLLMITLDLTEAAMMTAMRTFLLSVLPAGTDVFKSQVNRVPEPACPNFVMMTPTLRTRLATNRDDYQDCAFTGSIAGTVLTVTAVEYGSLMVGAPVYTTASGLVASITAQGTGTGGVGTYTVSTSQTLASGPLFAGVGRVEQDTSATVQLDVHGPASADNVQRITSLFRDDFGCQAFEASGFAIQPLYTSEPAQMPFHNGEMQVEWRWTVDAVLEIKPIVQHPQQFADEVSVELYPVE